MCFHRVLATPEQRHGEATLHVRSCTDAIRSQNELRCSSVAARYCRGPLKRNACGRPYAHPTFAPSRPYAHRQPTPSWFGRRLQAVVVSVINPVLRAISTECHAAPSTSPIAARVGTEISQLRCRVRRPRRSPHLSTRRLPVVDQTIHDRGSDRRCCLTIL
jgi:hypothetical protein